MKTVNRGKYTMISEYENLENGLLVKISYNGEKGVVVDYRGNILGELCIAEGAAIHMLTVERFATLRLGTHRIQKDGKIIYRILVLIPDCYYRNAIRFNNAIKKLKAGITTCSEMKE